MGIGEWGVRRGGEGSLHGRNNKKAINPTQESLLAPEVILRDIYFQKYEKKKIEQTMCVVSSCERNAPEASILVPSRVRFLTV